MLPRTSEITFVEHAQEKLTETKTANYEDRLSSGMRPPRISPKMFAYRSIVHICFRIQAPAMACCSTGVHQKTVQKCQGREGKGLIGRQILETDGFLHASSPAVQLSKQSRGRAVQSVPRSSCPISPAAALSNQSRGRAVQSIPRSRAVQSFPPSVCPISPAVALSNQSL